MLPEIPGVAEAANCLAQAHRQLAHRFDTLDGVRRKPVAAAEKQFGVAEDAGQLIIELVPQDFAETGSKLLEREGRQVRRGRAEANPPLHSGRGQWHKGAAAGNEIRRAGGDEEGQLPAALGRGHDDDRSAFHKQRDRGFESIHAGDSGFVQQRHQRLSTREDFACLGGRRDDSGGPGLRPAIEFRLIFAGEPRIGADDLHGLRGLHDRRALLWPEGRSGLRRLRCACRGCHWHVRYASIAHQTTPDLTTTPR